MEVATKEMTPETQNWSMSSSLRGQPMRSHEYRCLKGQGYEILFVSLFVVDLLWHVYVECC